MRYRSCLLCPRGHQCKNKDKEPEICPKGTYAGVGKIECTLCPHDMKCMEGSSIPELCTKDDPDWEVQISRRNLASTCSAGDYHDGDSTCLTCPEGYYWLGGTALPTACTGDTYSTTGGTSSGNCQVNISFQELL